MKYDTWAKQREEAQTLECGLKVRQGNFTKTNGEIFLNLQIWMPKAQKPFANYIFRTEEARAKYIADAVKSYESSQASKMLRKLERQGVGVDIKEAVKIGDIFNSSWGYDQTNQDFYQVTAINGYTVTIQEIGCKEVEGTAGFMCYDVMPVKDAFTAEKPIKKRLQFSGGKPYFKMASYAWARLWDGKQKYVSHYA